MTDIIINNPITLRSCILYEFTKGKTIFETYKELMRTLGDEFMIYPEFEFWYMRFAQGKFDLDYDTSLEPIKRQISDLPVDVFAKVGDYLHFEDRNRLRIVSHDMQFHVDNWNPKVTELSYDSVDEWKITQNSKKFDFWQYGNRMRPNPLHAVVQILKNPKLHLKKLTVCQNEKWMKIVEELKDTKIHVNNFTVTNPDFPINIHVLAPESLEEISIFTNEESVEKMNEIVNSEQCKRLKMLTIRTKLSSSKFSFEPFYGYPRFTIEFNGRRSELKVAEFIKKLMKCTQLELCNLLCPASNWDPIKKHLNQKDTLIPDFLNLRRYPIRGSNDFYEIDIGETCISIQRKS